MGLLEVRDLNLHYATPRGPLKAVDSLSFTLENEGECLALIGESGSGKSSLANALIRMLPSNVARYDGEVRFLGKDLMQLADEEFRREIRWKRMAVVFQGAMSAFNPVIKMGRQIVDRLLLEPGTTQREVRQRAEHLLHTVGLSAEIMQRYPHELSGGMKQRAAIAMALSFDPPLLILDEPTSALDVSIQAQIMNLLKRLKWEMGLSMIFITHDIALASDISDRIAVVHAGEAREIGTAEEVLLTPKDPYTEQLLASMPRLHGGSRPIFLSGAPPDLVEVAAGCRFSSRCPQVFDRCGKEGPPLFDVGGGHVARCWLREEQEAEVRGSREGGAS